MRVLLLNYEYPPLGGGAGVATQALARGLASRGVTVDVVTAGQRDDCRSEVLWDGHAPQEGLLTVYRVKSRRTGVHEAGMGGALSYLRARAPPGARADARRALRHRAPVLLPSHRRDAAVPDPRRHARSSSRSAAPTCRATIPASAASTARTALLRPLTRWIWRRASRVVAVCESLGRLALRTDPGSAVLGHPERRGPGPLPAVVAAPAPATRARSAASRSPGWWSARASPT